MSTLQHIDSEQAVLGACMSIENPHAYHDAAAIVGARDFFRPAHETIWRVIETMHNDNVPADPVLVAERLGAELERCGGHGYVITLYQHACAAIAVRHHAELIADAATFRRVLAAGKSITQQAEETDMDAAELVAWASDKLATARDERAGVDVLTSGYDTFMAATPEQRTMVIPGLLGEGDRVIVTGQGGVGKSTLCLQLAVCAAAGLPPFDWHTDDTYEPQRVTILDFENPNHRVKTRLWPMVKEAGDMGCDPRPQLTIGGSGNPLNLLNPQNALSLLRTVEHDKPQLLYIGPVYKMHNDDPDKETVVKKITDVLDSIRAMGVAIITEAHHTKEGRKGGTLEPSGSNLWTWWPEFGLGLRLQDGERNQMMRRCNLERWRIDRETAQWPDEVEASGKFGLAWARADVREWRAAS